MALYSFWNTRAENAAHNNDDRGIVLNHLVYPQITTFLLRAVPVFLAIYYGKGLVNWLIDSIPAIVTHIIQVLGGVLPALGIAMLMSIVIKNKSHFIFFFVGFVLLAFAKLSMIAIVFISALVAYLYYMSTGKSTTPTATSSANNAEQAVDNDDEYEDEDLF